MANAPIMNKVLLFLLLLLFAFTSCTHQMNVFRTGREDSKVLLDSMNYVHNGKNIVLPVTVNGVSESFLFDTGADVVLTKGNPSDTNYNAQITDANGNVRKCKVEQLNGFKINNHAIHNIYSFSTEFPAPLLCFANGVIGNPVIRPFNWLINENKVYFSSKPFSLPDAVTLNTFYYGANRLFSNVRLNGVQVDTCLMDYGGLFDIELPLELYLKHPDQFVSKDQVQKIETSYGVNGKSVPDTVLSMNCNIVFNGIRIDHVNIIFKPKCEKRIGYLFLRRFDHVAINNTDHTMLFSGLVQAKVPENEMLYSFDWINGVFEVDSKILHNDTVQFSVGDRFIEINGQKSSDFKDYCAFLSWKDLLANAQYLDLVTPDQQRIHIKNRR